MHQHLGTGSVMMMKKKHVEEHAGGIASKFPFIEVVEADKENGEEQ